MDKFCKRCGQTKSVDEFYGARAVCKKCFNIKRQQNNVKTAVIKDSKFAPVELPEEHKLIRDWAAEMVSLIVNDLVDAGNQNLWDLVYLMNDKLYDMEYDEIKFKMSTDDDTLGYLKRVYKNGLSLYEAERMIRYSRFDKEFLEFYGIDNDKIDKIYDNVTNLNEIKAGVEQAYYQMRKQVYQAECSKLSYNSGNKYKPKQPKVIDALFDCKTCEIVIDNNPLRYTKQRFLEELQKFIDSNNIAIMAFYSNGLYKNILKTE